MTERRLFELSECFVEPGQETAAVTPVAGIPRLRVACRDQVVRRMLSLDQMLPPDDAARTVVAFVEQADLSELYDSIRAVAALSSDTPPRSEWRQRMGTAVAQAIYKERASTAECVNALARQRGLTQFRVRGLSKVKIIATWFALAHNVLRWAFFQAHPRMAASR